MNYVNKPCNPTILNLSINKKERSLRLLDYRPKLLIIIILGLLFVCVIFGTSTAFNIYLFIYLFIYIIFFKVQRCLAFPRRS